MLVHFKTSNFLSFKEEMMFSLQAAAIKDFVDQNVFQEDATKLRLLKGAVLYGNNSAGKSNLIKALHFVKNIVLDSAKDLQSIEEVEPFKLSTTTGKRPSFFEVEFIASTRRFRLGFEVDKTHVIGEYLLEIKKTTETILYNRRLQEFDFADEFKNEAYGLDTRTRPDALFISVLAQFNSPTALSVVNWVRQILFLYDIDFRRHFNRTIKMISDEKQRIAIQKILKAGRLGFQDVQIKKRVPENTWNLLPDDFKRAFRASLSEEFQVSTIHPKYDESGKIVSTVELDLVKEESLGTQKYFALAGYIFDALRNGKLLMIDELDSKLHTLLASLIIRIFNSVDDNPNHAQLVFTTQNTNFLSEDLLRRDQIYLLVKNDFGATELKTLHDLGVRNDASYEKDYLKGEYGAVPYSGRPQQLNLFE